MKNFFYYIFVTLFLYSCSTSKKTSSNNTSIPTTTNTIPKETSDSKPIPTLYSHININYKINKKGIIDTFNYVFDDFAKQPLEFPEQKTTVKLKRVGNSKIDISGKDIKTTITMNVDVLVKTFLKDFKANGTLEMSFNTGFEISKDWNFTTNTKLINHQWIAKPKMDLGVINLPIETLSNYIIDKSKSDMELAIDKSIKESFNLRSAIEEIAMYTLTPYKLDDVFGGWMQMTADSAYFSPAVNEAQYTSGKIQLRTKMAVSSVPPVNQKPIPPVFAWSSKLKDSSNLSLFLELEYDYLTNIIKQNFVGKVFEEDGKKVEILDALVGKKENRLMISITTKGDFNGQLILLGVPAIDQATNNLYCKDIDVNVKTGNILHKAAAWLLKGKIKSELDKMLQFNLSEELKNMQRQVDSQVIELNKQYKMNMRVGLGSLDINDIILRPDRVNIYVGLKLKIDTILDNLGLFSN